MQFKEFNVKSILALIIIVLGGAALVFMKLDQIVIGFLIGVISQPVSYFFGDSKNAEKNKTDKK
jgi:Kef-type K+ transport system membrane component KefB